jgi:hypothetical protein
MVAWNGMTFMPTKEIPVSLMVMSELRHRSDEQANREASKEGILLFINHGKTIAYLCYI